MRSFQESNRSRTDSRKRSAPSTSAPKKKSWPDLVEWPSSGDTRRPSSFSGSALHIPMPNVTFAFAYIEYLSKYFTILCLGRQYSHFQRQLTVDDLDYKALSLLMERGRAPWTEVGEALDMSAPAAAERVRKLEERSVILGYRAITSPEAMGLPLLAFVHVTLDTTAQRTAFLKG